MRWVIALLVLAALGAGAFWYFGMGQSGFDTAQTATGPTEGTEPATESPGWDSSVVVTTADVIVSSPRDRVRSIGTGRALRSVEVTTDVAGIIEEIHFHANALIEARAPLLTLERDAQEIALRSAQADFENLQATFERYDRLRRSGSAAVSEAQLLEARAAMLVAEADVASAQYEVDRRVIRAPFTGQVGLSDLEVGGYLQQGAAVAHLVDDTRLLVDFDVPETAASAIEVGLPLALVTPSLIGRRFTGEVIAFDAVIDAQTRTLRVRASVDNEDQILLPGMTFDVSIAREEAPLPLVPAVAISWSREGAFVWRLDDDNTPQRVPVVIRQRTGDRVWIEADLSAGDRVIEDGVLKVSPGVPVVVDGTPGAGRRS